MACGWMLQSLILGKMTPVLQLTDTDIAFIFKAEGTVAKKNLMMDVKTKCREQGVRENFSCSHYEFLRIVHDALACMTETPQTGHNFVWLEEERHVSLAA